MLVGILLFSSVVVAHAQYAARPLPTWRPESLTQSETGAPHSLLERRAATRSHTGTGLLIGGIVGAGATTVFLIGFCGDPDTACGADEVGRAVLFIGLPITAAGALIGSLIRTEEPD